VSELATQVVSAMLMAFAPQAAHSQKHPSVYR